MPTLSPTRYKTTSIAPGAASDAHEDAHRGAEDEAEADAEQVQGDDGVLVESGLQLVVYNRCKLGKPQILCFEFFLITPFHCFSGAFEGV